jgi:hypothetical protein
MNIHEDALHLGESQQERGGRLEGGWRERYVEVGSTLDVYIKKTIMKSTKYCLKGGEEKKIGNGNTMERVNLFKVQCTHVWN